MAYNNATTVITIVITISLWKYPESGTTSMQGMSIGFQMEIVLNTLISLLTFICNKNAIFQRLTNFELT